MRTLGVVGVFPADKKEGSLNQGDVFPAKLPAGQAHNITPNGVVREHGGQQWGANGWCGPGNLGTRPTAEPFHSPPTGNRTGEDHVNRKIPKY